MATKADMKARTKRLLAIGEALASGKSYGQVQSEFAQKHKITERQIRKDIEQVRTQWAEEAEAEGKGDVRRNQLRRKLDMVFRKALAAGSYAAAVQAANRLMELDGLKTVKVEHSGHIDMNEDEINARIEKLKESLGEEEEWTH